jgi:NCS1 family nucleobase:cation symporter-1
MGGMIAAVGSVLLTPWNWYSNDDAIRYTLGILGALIGPLFGTLIAGFYIISRQKIWVDDMFTMSEKARYWFKNGYNPNAVAATVIGGLPAIAAVLVPSLLVSAGALSATSGWLNVGSFSWFIGCGLGYASFVLLERRRPMIRDLDRDLENVSDGALH